MQSQGDPLRRSNDDLRSRLLTIITMQGLTSVVLFSYLFLSANPTIPFSVYLLFSGSVASIIMPLVDVGANLGMTIWPDSKRILGMYHTYEVNGIIGLRSLHHMKLDPKQRIVRFYSEAGWNRHRGFIRGAIAIL